MDSKQGEQTPLSVKDTVMEIKKAFDKFAMEEKEESHKFMMEMREKFDSVRYSFDRRLRQTNRALDDIKNHVHARRCQAIPVRMDPRSIRDGSIAGLVPAGNRIY